MIQSKFFNNKFVIFALAINGIIFIKLLDIDI